MTLKEIHNFFHEHSVYEIVTDKWFATGVSGSLITIIVPNIDRLTHIVQFLAAIGGLFLVCLSITQKIIEIKKLKKNGNSGDRKRKS